MKFYSDITKSLYDSIQECEAAEAAHLKAEEEKKNGYNAAIAELDSLWETFQKQQKVQEDAYKDMLKMAKNLREKYAAFQSKYGSIPDKHYMNYIVIRMI